MRMPQQLEVLNLPLYSRGHVHVDDLLSVDDLHSDLVPGNRVNGDCVDERIEGKERAVDF